ncbi:hypothetical protein PR048_025187 [Dryococelus australis]|uniref:YqaJ viral recombinase domain-containing protein n=1 Tax=Dryococelus australis TaxID=614101 RepID=A0ABQ9GQS3_9NEOP|nr:hypothetical protein PR048_025187 [Dryococelus australis]
MEYGCNHEVIGTRCFGSNTGLLVNPCGLFLHRTNGFIGASPDGVVGDDAIIEIKCPESAKDMAITEFGGKIKKSKYNSKSVREKKCYFGFWIPKDIPIEEIEKRDDFWSMKMIKKLHFCYEEVILPEIIDPRMTRSLSIRNLIILNVAKEEISGVKSIYEFLMNWHYGIYGKGFGRSTAQEVTNYKTLASAATNSVSQGKCDVRIGAGSWTCAAPSKIPRILQHVGHGRSSLYPPPSFRCFLSFPPLFAEGRSAPVLILFGFHSTARRCARDWRKASTLAAATGSYPHPFPNSAPPAFNNVERFTLRNSCSSSTCLVVSKRKTPNCGAVFSSATHLSPCCGTCMNAPAQLQARPKQSGHEPQEQFANKRNTCHVSEIALWSPRRIEYFPATHDWDVVRLYTEWGRNKISAHLIEARSLEPYIRGTPSPTSCTGHRIYREYTESAKTTAARDNCRGIQHIDDKGCHRSSRLVTADNHALVQCWTTITCEQPYQPESSPRYGVQKSLPHYGTSAHCTSQGSTINVVAGPPPLYPRRMEKVAWTDESKYTLVHFDGTVPRCRQAHERMNPQCQKGIVQTGLIGILIWGLFTQYG